MSYADGTCSHNNLTGYCPSCIREKTMGLNGRGMGRLGMGACPDGYYDLKVLGFDTGQCVPNLNTAASAAGGAVTGSVATGVAQSAATQNAISSAAATAFGTKVMNFYKANPIMAGAITLGVGGLLIYGAMSFLRGK